MAYRNSRPEGFGGATELYHIDPATNDISEQTPPNDGTLVTEGMLERNVKRFAGFDIVTRGTSPAGDEGYASLQPMMNSMFYRVNLGSGRIAQIGRIGARGTDVEGLAIPIGPRERDKDPTPPPAERVSKGGAGRELSPGPVCFQLFLTASTTSWRPCLASEKSIMVLSVS